MADTTPEDLRLHGDRLVPPGALDFAVNVHGDGPAPHVLAAVTAALQHAHRYPDERPAVAAVAGRHGCDVTEVAVTAGAADAFLLLARSLTPRHAVVVHPSFTLPEQALRQAGVVPQRVLRRPEHGWHLDPDAIPDTADLVVVGNPNNPTGTLDAPERIAALCRPGRVVVVDEAFMDVVADPAASVAGRRDLPGLVVVRSVTKLWGLAGLRAGYVLGPHDLIARLAFVLVRVPRGPEAHRRLLAAGIAVRPSTFPGLSRDHLRVAVRPPAVAGRLIAALTAILSPHERIGSTPA